MARSRFKMSRSRSQIATAYAPGSFFTFEGGTGACVAVPTTAPPSDLPAVTRNQIMEQIKEFVEVWERQARSRDPGNGGPGPDVPVNLALDRTLIGPDQRPQVSYNKFEMLSPLVMGYVPDPSAFVCRSCGLIKSMKDVNDLNERQAELRAHARNGGAEGERCNGTWEQLDVVWVHPSGDYAPISPIQRQWENGRLTEKKKCGFCGHEHFRLVRGSPQFKDWHFQCCGCNSRREMLQNDRMTLQELRDQCFTGAGGHLRAELTMLPVSYRASSAYYVHGDRLLVFEDSQFFDLLKGPNAAELERFLGKQYGYPKRAYSDAEAEAALRAVGRGAEWTSYSMTRSTVAQMKAAGMDAKAIEAVESSLRKIEETWHSEVFGDTGSGSNELRVRTTQRLAWVRRYDPIRLAVEHKTFDVERLSSGATGQGGLPVCTRVDEPDRHMIPNHLSPTDVVRMKRETRRRLDLMGIADMRLVRDFKVCEFTFGYTRVEAYPTTEQKDMTLPVRLNLFPRFHRQQEGGAGHHPIYTVSQSNEALYVRLKEDLVLDWLAENHVPLALQPGQRIGGPLIEAFDPLRFTRFIDIYRKEKSVPLDPYACVFSLLHTMSHLLIDTVSELSGLDEGSFGEHLFVPDLAFVVYRRGVTMDLGNISSMWRSYANPTTGNQVLSDMVDPRALRCGSGTLCSMRGGACPDCIMIPETSCLCGNNLLSRAFLRGNGKARWDANETSLTGYFDMARIAMAGGGGASGAPDEEAA